MYRAVIIDDEPRVRRGMTALIPQLDPEWSVIGQAKNGFEGLELVRRERPDLVITDIRMPKMNGLDLLNQLRGQEAHVVILSGYGLFEYAQTAIKFGALDYLLKPMKPDQIQQVLQRVKALKASASIESSRNVLGEDDSALWKAWLFEGETDFPPDALSLVPLIQERPFRVLLIEIDEFDELTSEDQWGDRQLLLFAVKNIIQDVLRIHSEVTCVYMLQQGPQLAFLVENDPATTISESVAEQVRAWIKISVSIGLSPESRGLSAVPLAYRQAREAMQNKWIYGLGRVHHYGSAADGELSTGYPLQLEETLVLALRNGQLEDALKHLDQFKAAVTHAPMSYRLIRRYYLQLASSIMRLLYEYKIVEYVVKSQPELFEIMDQDHPLEQFHQRLVQMISACADAMEWTRSHRHQRIIERAIQYIHEHYMKEVSLEDVAMDCKMSSGYFSSFFKQEKGVTFIEYITRLRIDKAKTLMSDESLRLYEIAELVGYQDVKYFSRVFKRNVGVTPAEYRQFFFHD